MEDSASLVNDALRNRDCLARSVPFHQVGGRRSIGSKRSPDNCLQGVAGRPDRTFLSFRNESLGGTQACASNRHQEQGRGGPTLDELTRANLVACVERCTHRVDIIDRVQGGRSVQSETTCKSTAGSAPVCDLL